MQEQTVNNPIQQPPTEPVPVSKKVNHWLIAAIILAIIIFIGSIYILSIQSQKQITSPPPEPPLPPKITSQPSPIDDETANWKTYRNERYSYEIRYPYEWSVIEALPHGSESPSTGRYEILTGNQVQEISIESSGPLNVYESLRVIVLVNPDNLNLDQWADKYAKPDPGIVSVRLIGDTTLDKQASKKFSIESVADPSHIVIATIRNRNIYIIRFVDIDLEQKNVNYDYFVSARETLDQILSTFKFLE